MRRRSQPTYRSPLYRLTAFGITNPWNHWALVRGGMDAWCPRCRGRGVLVASFCRDREVEGGKCSKDEGCARCRRECFVCHGVMLTPSDKVRNEDFGDVESLRIAERYIDIPWVPLDQRPQPRMSMLGMR